MYLFIYRSTIIYHTYHHHFRIRFSALKWTLARSVDMNPCIRSFVSYLVCSRYSMLVLLRVPESKWRNGSILSILHRGDHQSIITVAPRPCTVSYIPSWAVTMWQSTNQHCSARNIIAGYLASTLAVKNIRARRNAVVNNDERISVCPTERGTTSTTKCCRISTTCGAAFSLQSRITWFYEANVSKVWSSPWVS